MTLAAPDHPNSGREPGERTHKSLPVTSYAHVRLTVTLRPVAPADDTFSENRTGLDHVCFSLASRADLDAAATKLDGLGVEHEGIKDIGAGFILEFRDPDGIALELMAPTG